MTSNLWNNPRQWASGEALTATKFNQQIKENMTHLREKNYGVATLRGNTDLLYNGASLALITNALNVSIVTTGNDIKLTFMGTLYNNSGVTHLERLDVKVNNNWFISSLTSTPLSDAWLTLRSTNTIYTPIYAEFLLTDMPAGSYLFQPYWSSSSGNMGLNLTNTICQFKAEEYGLRT